MAPYYIYFAHQIGIKVDQSLLESIQSKNVSALKSFEDRLEDAKLNLGETEVSQVLIAKAHYLAQIGEKVD